MHLPSSDLYWISFLPSLQCPITKKGLRLLSEREAQSVAMRIELLELLNIGGQKQDVFLTSYLQVRGEEIYYPIFRGCILGLLPFLALAPKRQRLHKQLLDESYKNTVRDYYEQVGWEVDKDGNYLDTARSTSPKSVAVRYHSLCNLRLNKHISGGDYLLDIASGPIPHDEYLSYSKGFKFRVCMDFSLRSLELARQKIGNHGIFVLGDATNIPLNDSSVDVCISLHTVYHIDSELQESAVREFQRVSRKDSLIVYEWDSFFMNCFFSLTIFAGKLRNWLKPNGSKQKVLCIDKDKVLSTVTAEPILYIHNHIYRWWKRKWRSSLKLYCWSSLSGSFLIKIIPDNMIGTALLRLAFVLESLFPYLMGRLGSYPIIKISKRL